MKIYKVLGHQFQNKLRAHKYLSNFVNTLEVAEYHPNTPIYNQLLNIIKMGKRETKDITKIIIYKSKTFDHNHILYYEGDKQCFFSYSCIFKKKSRKYMITTAMRTAVKSQIHEYRHARQYTLTCDKCDQPTNTFEVDHIDIPFSKIKDEFIKYYPEILNMGLKQYYNTFVLFPRTSHEARVLYEWEKYHKKHSKFQMLCVSCNRDKSNIVKK
jgi:hypothetical protein